MQGAYTSQGVVQFHRGGPNTLRKHGIVAQPAEATDLKSVKCGFESHLSYQNKANPMRRFLIYDPKQKSYIKMDRGGWSSGYAAEEVNSFASRSEAEQFIRLFDSLKHAKAVEVDKTVRMVSIV